MSIFLKKADRNNDHKISRDEFICHMNLSKYITDGQWDALFDELDADGNGTLCHSEFWSKMAIRNSSDLVDALKQFVVSGTYNLDQYPSLQSCFDCWLLFLRKSIKTMIMQSVVMNSLNI